MKATISFSFFILITCFSVRAQEAHHPTKKHFTGNMALARIRELPEVKAFLRKNKDKAMLMVAKYPEPGLSITG